MDVVSAIIAQVCDGEYLEDVWTCFVCFGLLSLCCSLDNNSIDAQGESALAAALRAHPWSLVKLSGIDLGQADPDLPLELRWANDEHILDYYRDLQSAPVLSCRARVLMLGVGGAGKTTLARRLAGGSPSAHPIDVTHGALQRTCARKQSDVTALFRRLHECIARPPLLSPQTTGPLTTRLQLVCPLPHPSMSPSRTLADR
jgi:hypothetical protein